MLRDPQDKQEIQTFGEEMYLTLLNVHAELASTAFRAVQSKKLAEKKNEITFEYFWH